MKILILCCGEQSRFGQENTLKQLLVFDNERLLDRTIRQCNAYGNPIVVTKNPQLMDVEAEIFTPLKHRWTCETILNTAELWDERTIILLGDVRYTDDCIDKIFKFNGEMQFFTDTIDFFAISLSGRYRDELEYQLIKTLANSVKQTTPVRLLHLYRTMDLPEHYCTLIEDETCDFDKPHEYIDFLNGKSKNRLYKKNINKTQN